VWVKERVFSGKVPLCCKTVRIWLVYATSDTSQQSRITVHYLTIYAGQRPLVQCGVKGSKLGMLGKTALHKLQREK